MTLKLIFVDDDTDVLRGLKRSLRPKRREWDMRFAVGGEEALSFMQEAPANVVFSDMRMPGMNGATLLSNIAQQWPLTARFILSGQAEPEAVEDAIGASHQFFAKPMDGKMIMELVDQHIASICSPDLIAITTIKSLPSPVKIITALKDLLDAQEPNIDKIAALIGDDIGLSAKLLQLSNSAYFGVGNATIVPGDAVRTIGYKALKSLIDHDGFCSTTQGNDESVSFMACMQAKCLTAANIADSLTDKSLIPTETNYGLLRQMCKFAGLSPIIAHLAALPQSSNITTGFAFARLWGFPDELIESLLKVQKQDWSTPETILCGHIVAEVYPNFFQELSKDIVNHQYQSYIKEIQHHLEQQT